MARTSTGIGRLILLVAAAALHTALRAAEPKPADPVNIMWRFDGSGRFPHIHPPADWRTDKNVLWKTPAGPGGYSSPIVVRDRVFVTAEMGSLICLDFADGKLLWQKDLFSKDSKDIPAELSRKLMRGCGGDSKQSTPTPTSNGELVFYLNAMGLCACYDLQGSQKWIRIVETAEDEEYFTASPLFAGNRIIVSWGCLLALDAKTGKTLWKATGAKSTNGTPALTRIGGEEVAITPAGDVVRLADGDVLCSGQFQSKYATPLVEGNIVYVVGARARALELPAKAEKGMRLKELWQTKLNGEFMASPILGDGLLVTVESKKCRLHILDAKTGEVLTVSHVVDPETKAEKLETGVKLEGLAPAQYTYASPVAAGKHVYFFDDAGRAAVLELARKQRLVRVNKLEDGISGTPFFIEDKIIIRGAAAVYCIGKKPEK
jgi:outer membrane protein assembly factor BamB